MRQLHLNWYGIQEWERMVARVLSLGWGVFWAWFGFASGVAEYASFGDVFLQSLPGLIFIGISLFAWKNPAAGGAILLVLSFVVFCAYWSSVSGDHVVQGLGTAVLLSLPPLMSGALFLSAAPGASRRDPQSSPR
jgi:hypothetical protein